MTRRFMEQTSFEHKGGLRVGRNCLDIGLSLATDCLQEKERSTNSSIATRYGREDNSVIKQEEAATGATMVEGMRRPTAVSFLDWRPKEEHVAVEKRKGESERGLDRMGSGVSFLSGYGGGGGGDTDASGDDLRRFNEGKVKLPWAHYKGVVPQPNGRWTGQIYESHQREREEDAARAYDSAVLKFWGYEEGGQGHPGSRFLSDHNEVQVVDMLRKRTYEEEELKKTSATEEDVKEGTTGRPSGDGGGREDEDNNNKKKKPSREHMFDKAVTPSDVGKLNRLVIPKQHAEKYFPLDTSANEKGLLLNFEDSTGKAWRFRYSYWNSSQSYVLTKGWSRFVKEKKLDAGDIVSFERGTDHDVQRLFISWRRRPSAALHPPFADPSKALLPGLPSLARPHIQYTNTAFQSHALNFRAAGGATLCQGQGQVVPSSLFKPFPLMSLVWSANGDGGGGGGGGGSGASSRATAEMWAEQMNVNARARGAHPHSQPMDFSLNDSKPARRFIEFESSRLAADVQNSLRDPLDFMRASERPPETKTGTSFDPSTSKKGVRLFGVNL